MSYDKKLRSPLVPINKANVSEMNFDQINMQQNLDNIIHIIDIVRFLLESTYPIFFIYME
jgi:hypothetical protein